MITGIELVLVRQGDDFLRVDVGGAVPTSPWRLDLYGFPIRFNELGAPEGPVRELGRRDGPGPMVFPLPADLPYGPYAVFGLLHDQQGPYGLTDALGLVLRDLAPAYSVTLRREALGDGVRAVQDVTGYRARLSVLEAAGLPRALFLFRENHDGVGRLADEFLGVCRPADLEDYPEGRPAGLNGKYRKAEIDLVTHRAEELTDLWRTVNLDVKTLVKTLEANRRLADVEVVVH